MFYTPPRTPTHGSFTEYQRRPLRLITAAYEAAGITPPDFGDDQLKELQTELTVEDAAEHYALALYDGGNAKALEQAITAITRATAAQHLKDNAPRLLSQIQQDNAHDVQREAITAITPAFQQVIAQLTDAAQQLPADNPLDKQAAFNRDLNTQWRDTTNALRQLGTFAVVGVRELYEAAAGLGALLPVVTIPDTTRPTGYDGDNGAFTPLPSQAGAPERDAIRTLAADALTSRDLALLNIARGKYGEHITFNLADTPELDRRVTAATTAHTPHYVPAPIQQGTGREALPTPAAAGTTSRWMNP